MDSPVNFFKSFWMGGFECSDKINAFGNRVDLLSATGHIDQLQSDYQMLEVLNIRTVREGIRWSFVEKNPYRYDWSVVEAMIKTAHGSGVQILWDLCHFGFPDDLTPLHPMFPRRFAAMARAFVQFYRSLAPDEKLVITPINEVSFLSWLGGEVAGTVPYCRTYGWQVKYALMKAYIEAVEAIKTVDRNVLIMPTEPLVNIVPGLNGDPGRQLAADLHEQQYQVFDILSGRICPELGGQPDYIDIAGLNYYYNNQWIANTNEFLPWVNEEDDVRWRSPQSLLAEVHQRYGYPFILSETSHPGIDRPGWIDHIGEACMSLLSNGLPLCGVCWYPVVDRPDWDHLTLWHDAGLWSSPGNSTLTNHRALHEPSAMALWKVHQQLACLKQNYLTTSQV